jgi:hypothetical protein
VSVDTETSVNRRARELVRELIGIVEAAGTDLPGHVIDHMIVACDEALRNEGITIIRAAHRVVK